MQKFLLFVVDSLKAAGLKEEFWWKSVMQISTRDFLKNAVFDTENEQELRKRIENKTILELKKFLIITILQDSLKRHF